jgi:hypothetical protein
MVNEQMRDLIVGSACQKTGATRDATHHSQERRQPHGVDLTGVHIGGRDVRTA